MPGSSKACFQNSWRLWHFWDMSSLMPWRAMLHLLVIFYGSMGRGDKNV